MSGVFIPFTLAQYGMVLKWIRGREKGWSRKLIANAIGGTITFIVFMIFLITKFSHVWPILIFLPLIVIVFLRIKGHYKDIAKQLKSTAMVQDMPIVDKNLAIVPVSTITSPLINQYIMLK